MAGGMNILAENTCSILFRREVEACHRFGNRQNADIFYRFRFRFRFTAPVLGSFDSDEIISRSSLSSHSAQNFGQSIIYFLQNLISASILNFLGLLINFRSYPLAVLANDSPTNSVAQNTFSSFSDLFSCYFFFLSQFILIFFSGSKQTAHNKQKILDAEK